MSSLNQSPRRVVATGLGLVSALGESPSALDEALRRGSHGLGPVTLFPLDGLPSRLVGEARGFDPARFFGERNYRPLDRTCRLAAASAQLALADAGIERENCREREVGLVLGTMFGGLKTIAEFDRRGLTAGPNYVKPLDFANSVINAPAGQTAIWHGLPGINSTITGGPTAGLEALAYAADLIRHGHAEALLAGGAEELCYEGLLSFEQGGMLAPAADGAPRPFAPDRAGFTLGEGAALLLLEEADAALARGARVYAEILGHGQAFDPGRNSGSAEALIRAIHLALEQAGRPPSAVAAVASGGSGSVCGDAAEAAALDAALGPGAASLPRSAVKAALGECLGASGALQTVQAFTQLTAAGPDGAVLISAVGFEGQGAALLLGSAGGVR